MADVRFLSAAKKDLEDLMALDPQIVKKVLKKILLISGNPYCGEGLAGGLNKFRKLTIGDRHWRIIWKVSTDQFGDEVVEIAEIWAVGARANNEVYEEMYTRIASLPINPATMALSEVIELVSKGRFSIPAEKSGLTSAEVVPSYLVGLLKSKVGMTDKEIAVLSVEAAIDIWTRYSSRS